LFGSPLAAAAGDHSEFVHAIVKLFEQAQHLSHMANHKSNSLAATYAALDRKRWEIASFLLQIRNTYDLSIRKKRFFLWNTSALRMRDSKICPLGSGPLSWQQSVCGIGVCYSLSLWRYRGSSHVRQRRSRAFVLYFFI
jgi:hypothetical protein